MEKDYNFFKRGGVNLDVSNLCALECPRCQRQTDFRNKGLPVPGQNISTKNFKKILDFFEHIDFEGQYSDPVHHPNFIDFLSMCYEHGVRAEIHNASSTKPKKWYYKAFDANPDAHWVFAIDGLPETSHKYRINQDGVKLFELMCDAQKILDKKPTWQYIVFSYNENEIDQAINLAAEADVNFYLLQSARWISNNDPLMPGNKFRMSRK